MLPLNGKPKVWHIGAREFSAGLLAVLAAGGTMAIDRFGAGSPIAASAGIPAPPPAPGSRPGRPL